MRDAKKMIHTVGIGDIIVTSNEEDKIITHALGSCVAVICYCKTSKIAGMIHIALPSRSTQLIGTTKMGYYADDGLEALLKMLRAHKNFSFAHADIVVVGGANPSKSKDVFKIGLRNLEAVRHILNSNKIVFNELDVGGIVSRTVELDVKDGKITIRRQPLII